MIREAKGWFRGSSMRTTPTAQPAERLLELRERNFELQNFATGASRTYDFNHTSNDPLVWQRFEESWRDGQIRDESSGDESLRTHSTPPTHRREIRNESIEEIRDEDSKIKVAAARPRVEAAVYSPIERHISHQRTLPQVNVESLRGVSPNTHHFTAA